MSVTVSVVAVEQLKHESPEKHATAPDPAARPTPAVAPTNLAGPLPKKPQFTRSTSLGPDGQPLDMNDRHFVGVEDKPPGERYQHFSTVAIFSRESSSTTMSKAFQQKMIHAHNRPIGTTKKKAETDTPEQMERQAALLAAVSSADFKVELHEQMSRLIKDRNAPDVIVVVEGLPEKDDLTFPSGAATLTYRYRHSIVGENKNGTVDHKQSFTVYVRDDMVALRISA
ncbi:MAG: hypothetical protein U0Q15_08085 [Kineosporiaceae bacterium]